MQRPNTALTKKEDKSNWSLKNERPKTQRTREEEKREEEEDGEKKKRREEERKSKKVWILVWILGFLYGNHEFGMGLCVFGPW